MYSFFDNTSRPINEYTDISGVWGAYTRSYTSFYPAASGEIYNFGANKKNFSGHTVYNFSGRNNYPYSLFSKRTYNFKAANISSKNSNFAYSANPFIYTQTTVSKNTKATTVNSAKTAVKNKTSNVKESTKDFGKQITKNAAKYLGYNEKDSSYLKFTDNPEWCADFVTYVVNETYRQNGLTIPKGFGNWRTENIRRWAEDNNSFLQIAGTANRAQNIKEKVKPGDLMVLRENGASHIGIVTYVNPQNGSFKTIEGNVPNSKGIDSVVENSYKADEKRLTGFVQLRI